MADTDNRTAAARLREIFIDVVNQTHDEAMGLLTESDEWRLGAEWFGATLAMHWAERVLSKPAEAEINQLAGNQ